MTKSQFLENGEAIGRRAQVTEGIHGYFKQAAPRLYHSCELFGLFAGRLGDVLEIGPFYGYTPFLLRQHASSYTVLEGDDPVVYPLVPIYEESSIALSYIDFFDLFGPAHTAKHKLPGSDSSYDTILCWQTMEHFNFNPVKFVRELYRLLKPSGRVCITVPNRISFQAIRYILFGRNETTGIDSYFQFEDYESNGKKAFYGFHWREYAPAEMRALFTKAGFNVEVCHTFTEFQDRSHLSFGRKIARLLLSLGTSLLPRFGTNVYLIATKP